MSKIQRISKVLQRVFKFFLVALPLLAVTVWFYMPIPNPLGIKTSFFPTVVEISHQPVEMTTRLLGFLVNLPPLLIEMFSIYCLIQLFKLFEAGKIFTAQNVQYIRYIGIAMISGEILRPFTEAITTLVMTYHNIPGHRMISVSLGNQDISNILIGVIILLISWIMAEACKLQEEQTLTI